MDSIENQQATTEVDEKGLLLLLINKLNFISENPRDAILEINYLSEFPPYNVILPIMNFSPRQIIEYMISTHAFIKYDILAKSYLLRIIIYKFRNRCSDISQQFTFSNNMSLAADICTICYLHHLLTTPEYFDVKVIHDLYFMMIDKYHLQSFYKQIDSRTITDFSITCCFPSISFPWFAYNSDINKLRNPSHFMYTMFPGLMQEPLLWIPMIASLIPRLENSKFVPIALLTAINVKTNQIAKDLNGPNYADHSLNMIYRRILEFNSSEAFPEILKLELCKMWGIVYPSERGIFKYSDYFATYRSVAMDIISELKSQDPDLQTILSEIHLEI